MHFAIVWSKHTTDVSKDAQINDFILGNNKNACIVHISENVHYEINFVYYVGSFHIPSVL